MRLKVLDRVRSAVSGLRESARRGAMLPTSGPPPVAVDFGASSLKVIHLLSGEGAGADAPALGAIGEVPTPKELSADPAKRLAHQVESLPRLIKELGIKGKRAACAIPASQVLCKPMQVALNPAWACGSPPALAEIASRARATVGAAMGVDPDSLVVRPVVIQPTSGPGGGGVANGSAGRADVLCLAASRSLVARLMDALRSCGMEPVAIHPEFLAALRAFNYLARRDADGLVTNLFLDMGYGTTKVLIAHGKDLVFAKTIQFGGRHLDDALAAQRGLPIERARIERLVLADFGAGASGAPEGRDVPIDRRDPSSAPAHAVPLADGGAGPRDGLSDLVEGLTDEIGMCVRYHQSMCPERAVDRVVFIGGESRHRALCQSVARALNLPGHVADALSRLTRTGKEPAVGVDLAAPQPGWAVPLGLSLSPTDL